MNPFSKLRVRLVVTVFAAITPAGIVMYLFDLRWMGVLMGALGLWSVWYAGEHFVLKKVRDILAAARRLERGDLTSRTTSGEAAGELGELAGAFDQMAGSIETRARESETAQRTLSNRAQQQTAAAAVGQFALVGGDYNSLLHQAVTMAAETLEVEFAHALTVSEPGDALVQQAGVGWNSSDVCLSAAELDKTFIHGSVFSGEEPVVFENLRAEKRFQAPALLTEHQILSGMVVVVATRERAFGVLGVYSRQPRAYTGDELNFLVALATALGLAAERHRAEREMEKLAAFARLNPNPVYELAANGEATYFNDAALRLAQSLQSDHPHTLLPPTVAEIVGHCLAQGQSLSRYETKLAGRTLSWSFHPVIASGVVHCYVEDITDRLNLEAQLRQSQKMESVGQLAAGIAHDFNNMLTIIQGHAGLMMAKAAGAKPFADSSQAIHFASERAAALTRQLLVFSRKNVIQRKLLDMREVVAHMNKMLRRLLGETVELQFTPPTRLPLVHGDSGMLEQVLMNLVVNARDAMPKGGTLGIALDAVEVTAAMAQKNPQAREGLFVALRVSDTGMGMDPATMSRIFEPFFTTKEVGKGTGLGLATVYGIVRQHAGWIEVASEPGKGSTFSVLVPASAESLAPVKDDSDPAAFIRGGKETILMVEDEPVVRDMAMTILQEGGYRILPAGTGREAEEIWQQEAGKIDLLLTDVVMPGRMSGMDLAARLLPQQPQLKVLLASGYTADNVSEEFLKKHNAMFLPKPYTSQTLARAVRQALDGAAVARTE